MKRTPQSKQQSTKPTEAQLGKMLVSIYESGYLDRTEAYKMSFIKGILGGLGGVIGATVVIALIIWGLSFFDNIPVIGRFVDKIENTVNSQNQ